MSAGEKVYPHTDAHRVDVFIYCASMGLGHKEQQRSMELFCKEVMPALA